MAPDSLKQIGQRLYGNRWKTPLAKALGFRRETVSRWCSGKQPIPHHAVKALKLLELHQPKFSYQERRHKAYGKITRFNNATLIHGDSRKVNLLQQVDVILTDPVWPNAISELPGAHNPEDLFYEVINHLLKFLKPDGRIIIQLRCDSDPRILSAIPNQFPYLRAAWLPYALPSPQGRVLISGDVGYIFGKPPKSRAGNHVLPGQLHEDFCPKAQPVKTKNSHPCPRHITHVEWLVEKFTNPNDVVLDPFMGSGTTAVAALNRGRQFVGIEIDEKYYIATEERIKSECYY